MIVGQNDCGGIYRHGLFDDLPRLNAGAVYSAPKQFFELNNSMSVIEIQPAIQPPTDVPLLAVLVCSSWTLPVLGNLSG